MQLCVKNENPTDIEIENIAKAIAGENMSLVVKAMEIDCDLEKSKRPEYTIISEYVFRWNGTRYKLAEHLREAGFIDVSTRYNYININIIMNHC